MGRMGADSISCRWQAASQNLGPDARGRESVHQGNCFRWREHEARGQEARWPVIGRPRMERISGDEMRYSDTKSVGRSDLVPWRAGESHSDRHGRRLNDALRFESVLQAWCDERGVALKVSNEGHHWRFMSPKVFAEWWPSSAKLVFDKKYQNGVHCHDVEQVATLLAKRINA